MNTDLHLCSDVCGGMVAKSPRQKNSNSLEFRLSTASFAKK
jgi:hypothetical protein